jgi:hypothetical protein
MVSLQVFLPLQYILQVIAIIKYIKYMSGWEMKIPFWGDMRAVASRGLGQIPRCHKKGLKMSSGCTLI